MAYIQITEDEIIFNTGIHEPRVKTYNKADFNQLRVLENYEGQLIDLIVIDIDDNTRCDFRIPSGQQFLKDYQENNILKLIFVLKR